MTRYISFLFLLSFLSVVAEGRELPRGVMADNLKVVLAPIQLNAASSHVVIPRITRTLLDASSLMPSRTKAVNKAELKQKADGFLNQSGIRFQENRGQIIDTDGKVRNDIAFVANAPGARLYFRNNGISYVFTRELHTSALHLPIETMEYDGALPKQKADIESYRLDMTLIGCNPRSKIRADGALSGYVNYYLPHCPDGLMGIREYGRVVYENIYDKVDFELFSVDGRMKYNFVVRPGGDPRAIRMKYDGAQSAALTREGALAINTPLGRIEESAPYSYAGETSTEIASRFVKKGHTVSFIIGDYDKTQTLTIDPWATYYGGSERDIAHGIDTDASGNILVCGETYSSNFPVQNPYQGSHAGGSEDAFVVKFNGWGSRLWATYYGGSHLDYASSISVDGNGNVVISGVTVSTDLPVQNAFQSSHAGGSWDCFIVQFNGNGTRQWATYYGGSSLDGDNSIDVKHNTVATDGNGNVVLTHSTTSTDLPVQNAFQDFYAGNMDAFVVKFNVSGVLQWATYYGGTWNDFGHCIATDGNGNVVIGGGTWSDDFPVLNAFQGTRAGNSDAFVVKFDGSGTRQWATYYGGTGGDDVKCIATDGSGNVVFGGNTSSTNFPIENPHQVSSGGAQDVFVVKFNGSGTRQWATYYGGSGADIAYDIDTDGNGNVVFAGWTSSGNFPVQNPAQGSNAGAEDAFVVKFNGGGVCQWATYVGGNSGDKAYGIATDGSGNVTISGLTMSWNFPVVNPLQVSHAGGSYDAFVVHFDANGAIPVELDAFTARHTADNDIQLQWTTTTETNNFGFEVEKMVGHKDWNTEVFIPGNGTTTFSCQYEWTDLSKQSGIIAYRLKQIDLNGTYMYSHVVEVEGKQRTKTVELSQNHPNPFNPSTTIEYSLTEDGPVILKIFNMLGMEVATLVNDTQSAGPHTVTFNAQNLESGVYTYTLSAAGRHLSRKMSLQK